MSEAQETYTAEELPALLQEIEAQKRLVELEREEALRRADRAERELLAARFDMDETHRTLSERLFAAQEQIRGLCQEHIRDCGFITEACADRDEARRLLDELITDMIDRHGLDTFGSEPIPDDLRRRAIAAVQRSLANQSD